MKVIPGFKFLNTKHCITGSILHLFHFYGCEISEEMLLGLGSGVGFIYWQQEGSPPFLGGRANTAQGGKNENCLEVSTAERCGVSAIRHTTTSLKKAEKALLNMLENDIPIMIQVDMGLLPYFPFYGQYHFGYHGVVAAGFDPKSNEVTIADRDATPYPVLLNQVSEARNSTFKPFPPKNTWMEYDFSAFRQPDRETLRTAILECTHDMLHAPIRNLGVRGIQTAKERMLSWPETMSDREIKAACENISLYIRADAGTGGGLFRWMYADFLREAAEIIGTSALIVISDEMRQAGDHWEKLADLAAGIDSKAGLKQHSAEAALLLDRIAALEGSVWSKLESELL